MYTDVHGPHVTATHESIDWQLSFCAQKKKKKPKKKPGRGLDEMKNNMVAFLRQWEAK
jgi:hypothetical protein